MVIAFANGTLTLNSLCICLNPVHDNLWEVQLAFPNMVIAVKMVINVTFLYLPLGIMKRHDFTRRKSVKKLPCI